MMIRLMVWAFALTVVAGKEVPTLVTAACRDNIILPCDALQIGQSYTSVTWYKVHPTHSSILISQKNVLSQSDKGNSSVSLGKNASLILWKAAPTNAGMYECLLRAKAGQNFCRSQIELNISDCMATTALPIFNFSTYFMNGADSFFTDLINGTNSLMNSSQLTPIRDDNEELYVILALLGLALCKLLLSALCIKVFEELKAFRGRLQGYR
nr:uncharacterized protein LOC129414662 [Misgurnus anguillicaudatus]XP_055024712.1 uncharacterized protein LOC129414662 [Misgurnus anguillicaudatus]